MPEKLKQFLNDLNSKGIPIPLFRDPKTGVGSISFSLVIISAMFVAIGLIGKLTKLLEGVDIVQALTWFGICSTLYYGRSKTITTKALTLENKDQDENKT